MSKTFYIVSPKGEIIESTGAPSRLRSKRLFLRAPIGHYTQGEVEKKWTQKRREGYTIKEQPGLFS